jgi:hypothetical protein
MNYEFAYLLILTGSPCPHSTDRLQDQDSTVAFNFGPENQMDAKQHKRKTVLLN